MKKKCESGGGLLLTPSVFKLLRVMKLSIVFICVLGLMATFGKTYSQNSKLTFKLENSSIEKVLNYIEGNTEYSFMYDNKEVDVTREVNINVEDKTIDEILNQLFDDNFEYKMIGNHIIINRQGELNVGSQIIKVSGKVIDSKGTLLPGVTVVVKGTTNGTITNFDGVYTLTDVPSDGVIQFSFVGMKMQEIPVSGKTSIDVVMEEDAIGIEEVVAIGYGTQKKVNLTGSVGVADAEVLESRPVQNTTQALQGLIPGLNITQNNGELGAKPSINIRGITTIGQGSSGAPLVLIDGMEGDVNTINPNDIENISVLKDAAASSIYGSRAPFGVILITTKSGKTGKTVVSYSNNFRYSSPVNLPEMADSYSFMNYFNEARVNAGQGVRFIQEKVDAAFAYQNGELTSSLPTSEEVNDGSTGPGKWANPVLWGRANTEWYGVYYKDWTPSQEHNINISGGKDDVKYYVSGNYLKQDGLLRYGDENYERYNLNGKITAQVYKNLTLTYNSRYVRENYNKPVHLTNDFYWQLARQSQPQMPVYDPNGYFISGASTNHAHMLEDSGQSIKNTNQIYQQLQITYEPVKGWKIFGEGNFLIEDWFQKDYDIPTYNHDIAGNPFLYTTLSSLTDIVYKKNYHVTNVYSEYAKEIKGHSFKFLAGFQSEINKIRRNSASRQGLLATNITELNATSGVDYQGNVVPPTISGYSNEWSVLGFFGRINYNYKERYLIEGNLRYDGSSRFRDEKRWNWFPSLSLGWNVSRESFWKLSDKISLLKIRASYGELGNQNTDNWYPTYSTMGIGIANGTWLVNGAKPNTSGSPALISSSLTWEKINTWNIGLDAGFFNNRLTASVDFFNRKTYDMVGPAPELPAILGTGVPRANNTDLKTYGFESEIRWNDRLESGINYKVSLLLSDSQTKITNYPNETENLNYYYSDQKMGEIWGYKTVGIAKSQEEMDEHLATMTNGGQSRLGSSWAAGDIMYEDVNNDGKIDNGAYTKSDHGDFVVIGNNLPRYNFGIDCYANWKGFDFRIFFQGVLKRDIFRNGYYFWGASESLWNSTMFLQHKDYFRNDPNHPLGLNLDSYYPRPVFSSKNLQTQTRYLQNAAYIRLKNVQIGYSLPSSFLQKVRIKKLRVYASGENLWTGTNLIKIFDPETVTGGSYGNVYPLMRTISIGINANF